MLFLVSGLLLVFTVVFFVSLCKLQRLSEVILAWALTAFSCIVLTFQVANLFSKMNDVKSVLLIQAALLLIGFCAWFIFKRPRLFPEIHCHFKLHSLLKEKKNWPVISVLGILLLVLLVDVVLIYIVPPNNNDALSIHLARVIKWKQMGSYFPWETPYIWQVTFPVNAQLSYFWTILFTNTDHFVAYIPFLAGLVSALLVYLLTREMGFGTRSAVFSAAVWLSFPVVQLHLTSARHDLISTWLFLSCLYFLCRWGVSKRWIYAGFSGLALGLVIGTNLSIAAYLPGLVIMVVLWLFTRRYTFRQIMGWGGLALLAFLIFSSPIFISNMIHFQSPVGPDAAEMTSAAMTRETSLGDYLSINITRWCYQLLDFSALPHPLSDWGVQGKAWIAEHLFNHMEGDVATMNAHQFHWATQYALQEDEAWYGLIGALLVFPTSVVAFIKGIRKKQMLYLAPLVFLITSLITCSLIRPGWTPYDGRYFMPLAAVCVTLLPMWFEGKKSAPYIQSVAAFFAALSILMVIVYNPAKQIVGGSSIKGQNRIDLLTRQSYNSKEMLYLVEAVVPEDGVLGIATNHFDYQEYGLYGEHFNRTLVEIDPPEKVNDVNWLRAHGVDYLLVLVSDGFPGTIPDAYQYIDSLGSWMVYQYQP